MRPSDRLIQTFDPLLRDLIAWGLVSSDGARWELSEHAQLRLTELAQNSGPWPAEQTVYFGHRCTECGTKALTRLHDGVHVCGTCLDKVGEPKGVDPVVAARVPRILPRRNVQIA